MIPESFFSEIGHKSPFLLDKGTLYQLYYEPRSAKGDKKGEIVVRLGELTLYGLPSLKLEKLEKNYLEKNEAEIIKLQEQLIKKVIKEAEIYSERKLQETLSKFETATYIINEILPNFQESKDEIAGLLKNEKVAPSENFLEKLIGKEYSQETLSDREFNRVKEKLLLEAEEYVNPEAGRRRRQAVEQLRQPFRQPVDPVNYDSEQDELLRLLRKNRPVVQQPEPVVEKASISKESIKKENYDSITDVLNKRVLCVFDNIYIGDNKSLELFDTLDNFDLAYRKMHEKNFIIESIDRYEDQIKKTGSIKAKTEALTRILEKGSIEMGDVGFGMRDGESMNYVYLKVPEFALKDPNSSNSYYAFPACRIAVKVTKRGGSIDYNGPYVMESYTHPFLSSTGGSWSPICMGDYHNPGNNNTERIINLLSHGRNVIQRGYIRGSNPYHRLHEDSAFSRMSMSESEIRRRNIPITNIWR